jgi:hypothetical protein
MLTDVLAVGAGMALLFLFVSLIASAAAEGLEAAITKRRPKELERGIRAMLDDGANDLTGALYNHPLVFSLFRGDYRPPSTGNLPSYIPAKTFADALLDIIHRGGSSGAQGGALGLGPPTAAGIEVAAAGMQNTKVRRAVLSAADAADGDLDKVRAGIEAWFDATMDRVSAGTRNGPSSSSS